MAIIDGSRIAAEIEAEQKAEAAALVRDHARPRGLATTDIPVVAAGGLAGLAGLITPVPGGADPMTVAMLLANTFRSARAHLGG